MARVEEGHMERGTVTYTGKAGECFAQKRIVQLQSILRFYSLTRIQGVLKCVALFPNQSSASSLTSWYFLFIQSFKETAEATDPPLSSE